jgi:hypothetical protein
VVLRSLSACDCLAYTIYNILRRFFKGVVCEAWFCRLIQLATVLAGNELPAALIRLGVLVPSSELATVLAEGRDLQGQPLERTLRATAVVAARRLAAEVPGGGVSPWQVGKHLIREAEAEGPLQGHVAKGSKAY